MTQCLRTLFIITTAVAAFTLPATAGQPPLISFYSCLRCDHAPVIDGKLDDPCWQTLPVMDQFYKYWTPTPEPPPLKTAARLCYDDRGLYMGITMYEDHMDKIRARVERRDDPETWMDDCVEIMIDPANTGTGYFKFCTNFLGARYDEKATNMVLDSGWNVEGWQVKNARVPAGWAIEFFLPWTDLDQKPKEGSIWSFDLIRYGWATGDFKGVSWSLGGSGAHPTQLGYLGFGPMTQATLPRLAQAATPTKGKTFRLLLPREVQTYAGAKWTSEPMAKWLAASLAPVGDGLGEVRRALVQLPLGPDRTRLNGSAEQLSARFDELKARADVPKIATGAAAMIDHDALMLRQQVNDLRYEALLMVLVAQQ